MRRSTELEKAGCLVRSVVILYNVKLCALRLREGLSLIEGRHRQVNEPDYLQLNDEDLTTIVKQGLKLADALGRSLKSKQPKKGVRQD